MSGTDMMTPSQAALDLIHEFEQGPRGGMASVPYRDFAGHMTIGWGHKILPHERFAMPLNADQADDLLLRDLEQFAGGVNELVTAPITQSMFDALVCFAFNVGLGSLKRSTLMRLLNKRLYLAASQQFARWNKATDPKTGKKVPLLGLTRRRLAESKLFMRGGVPG